MTTIRRDMVLVAWKYSTLLKHYLRQESGREHLLREHPFYCFARERRTQRLVRSPFAEPDLDRSGKEMTT